MPPPRVPPETLIAPKPRSTQLMLSQPGVVRDGTRLSRQSYVDALWCRFWQKRPRKMKGFRELSRTLPGVGRQLFIFNNAGTSYVYAGTSLGFYVANVVVASAAVSSITNRTPTAFVGDADTNWQIDTIYDDNNSVTQVFAHPSNNLGDISSVASTPVYYGAATGVAILDPIPLSIESTGGICCVGQYLFLYGVGGLIQWSVPGTPLDFAGAGSGSANPTSSKIVRGLPLRGSAGPAIILWSLDALIIGQFVGTPTWFRWTTVTTSGSILSSNGVIENNGIYYWATTNGFSKFDGVMRDIPNDMNLQWFLDNLNIAERQKVFAMKFPRWNEIWWCFPYGDATECTHAVIYNYKDNIWYDTLLPNEGRTSGVYDVIFNHPLMTGADTRSSGVNLKTSLWQHEDEGYDEISGDPVQTLAVRSYFETHEFNVPIPTTPATTGVDQSLSYSAMEPDFDQEGDLLFYAYTRANAKADPILVPHVVVPEVPTTTNDQITKLKFTGRLTSFVVESNVAGGSYVTGSPVVHFRGGDGRREG